MHLTYSGPCDYPKAKFEMQYVRAKNQLGGDFQSFQTFEARQADLVLSK